MKPKIILNADDFGAMDGIDQGIIAGIKAGVVNSVSTFVNFPDSYQRIANLLSNEEIKGKFKLGLHLSITSGYGDNPELYETLMVANSNKFATKRDVNLKIVDLNELKICLQEQIDKLANWLGGYQFIDHINMHHNLWNLHPDFFNVQLELRQELMTNKFNIPTRSPFSWSKSGLKYYKYDGARLLPAVKEGLETLSDFLTPWTGKASTMLKIFRNTGPDNASFQRDAYAKIGIKHAFCFVDQYYGQPFKKNLERILEHHKEGEVIEFMLHLFLRGHKLENKNGININYLETRMIELETLIEHFDQYAYTIVNHCDL
ncbi:ChbG/HpnK family deacetylase [Crocinitomix catalasitica]|uniref:ChbG/HpnK family deacetylase n=1 Tax=Crocinitomix catalasitica TaxID=184607 RepID=UPI000480E9B4|nr:ChbG/HpnK family deacetylase [Crocinitomix catalasitica]